VFPFEVGCLHVVQKRPNGSPLPAAMIGMDSSPFVRGIMCRGEGLGSTS